jgi:hypothetical protein
MKRSVPFLEVAPPGGLSSLKDYAAALDKLIADMGNCRVIVGRKISGAAYYRLDSHGFCICEMDAFSADLLPGLAAKIAVKDENPAISLDPVVVNEAQGIYLLDLHLIQSKFPDMSSKKVLKPIIEKFTFKELEVVCGHFPPWLAGYLPAYGCAYALSSDAEGRCHVHIKRLE